MADRRIVIATAVLAAGAAAVVAFDRRDKPRDPRLGQALLPTAAAAGVDRIELSKGAGGAGAYTVLARDGAGGWHLHDPIGFPVDAAKVVQLLDDLGRVKFEMLAGTGKDQLDAFGLTTPTQVVVYEHGKAALDVRLGAGRKTGGGQYLSVAGDDRVYLTGQALAAGPDEADWELKTLLDVPKALLQTVTFAPPPGSARRPVTLTRAKGDEPMHVAPLAAGEQVGSAAKGVEGLFTGITYAKRYDAGNAEAKAALDVPTVVTLGLFDGRAYELRLGSIGDKQKKYFLALHAAVGTGVADKKAHDSVDTLNALAAGQAFELPEWLAQRLDLGRADVLEAGPAGKSRASR